MFELLLSDGRKINKIPCTTDSSIQKKLIVALEAEGITKKEILLDTLYRYYKEGFLTPLEWEDYKKDILLRGTAGGELAIKK